VNPFDNNAEYRARAAIDSKGRAAPREQAGSAVEVSTDCCMTWMYLTTVGP